MALFLLVGGALAPQARDQLGDPTAVGVFLGNGDPAAGTGRRAHFRRGCRQAELSNATFETWLARCGTAHQAQDRQLVQEERLWVAREVHDVVSHGLAVINVQASVALHLIRERPGQAEVALAAIKTTSRDALDELRGILAEFRRAEGWARRGGRHRGSTSLSR